jgi:hypothetical protein
LMFRFSSRPKAGYCSAILLVPPDTRSSREVFPYDRRRIRNLRVNTGRRRGC